MSEENEEILVNFKDLMGTWFPLTTEVENLVDAKRDIQRTLVVNADSTLEEGHYYCLGGIVNTGQNQGMSFLDVFVNPQYGDMITQVCYEYDYGESFDNDVHQYIRYSTDEGINWSSWKRFAEESEINSLSDSITNHTHDNRYYTEAEVRSLINQSIKIVFSGQIEFGSLSANGGNATKTATINIPSGYSVLTVFPRTWYGCDSFSIVSISGSTISVRAWNLSANPHGAWVTVGAICIKNG